MSLDWYEDIKDFHDNVVGEVTPPCPKLATKDKRLLRAKLIGEEVTETIEALYNNDLEKIADGIVDSIVVLIGTALVYGIDIRPVWDEIHKTNMAKAGGAFRDDGKLLKPEGWKEPDIASILGEQVRRYYDK